MESPEGPNNGPPQGFKGIAKPSTTSFPGSPHPAVKDGSGSIGFASDSIGSVFVSVSGLDTPIMAMRREVASSSVAPGALELLGSVLALPLAANGSTAVGVLSEDAGSSKSSKTLTSSPEPERIVVPTEAKGRCGSTVLTGRISSPSSPSSVPSEEARERPRISSSKIRDSSAIFSKSKAPGMSSSPSFVKSPKAEKSAAGAAIGSSHRSSGFSASLSLRALSAAEGGGNATPRCHLPPPELVSLPLRGGGAPSAISERLRPLGGGPGLAALRGTAAQITSASNVSQQTGSCGSSEMITFPAKGLRSSGRILLGAAGRMESSFSLVKRIIFPSSIGAGAPLAPYRPPPPE
mmetsp:Transcript_20038/g.41900  ORF Transcript_20038/g.41900 Transcript_20038/m.41900 type:complete len:350 (+) Transcript_20038:2179-3228(+)